MQSGETVSLNSANGVLANVVIPGGVTALHDFASLSALNLSGNLNNAGTFYAFSSSSGVAGGIISAQNIFNQQGALLTSVLPAGGIAGINSAVGSFNLTLNALQNIVNAGTISSSGSLTATAGGSIVNLMPATGPSALMQALGNIDIQAASILNAGTISSQTGALNLAAANMVNSGLLQSVMSNINVNSLLANSVDLSILNANGAIEALSGSLNLRTPDLSELGDLSITGGDIAAQSLNAYARKVDIAVHDLSARVNITGSEAHVSAVTETLTLGDINLSGDPTFFNRLGDVQIAGNLIFSGQALALVAARDIVSTGGNPAIVTSSSGANGGDITMIAGVDFTGPASGSGDTTSTLVLTNASATGGKIMLNNGNPLSQLDSSSTKANGSAGNITLVAFKGSNAGSGTIDLPQSVTIHAHGNGSGSNGTVTLLAGATSGTAITVGDISNSGGAAGTGDIVVRSATPTFSVGASIFNGTLSGSLGSSTPQNADISMRSFVAGNDVMVTTAGNVGLFGRLWSLTGGSISVVTGGNITNPTTDLSFATENNSGDAGGMVFVAGAGFTQSGNQITITGASAGGGSFSVGTVGELKTTGSGAGGNVTMLAFAGANAGSGQISLPSQNSSYRILTGGSTSSGDVTIMAGNTSGATLVVGGVWTEGGASSTGGNITLSPSTPLVGAGVTYDLSKGSITSGTLSSGTLQNSDVRIVGPLVSNGKNVSITSLGSITLGAGYGEGHMGGYSNRRGGTITLVAGGDIVNTGTDLSVNTANNSGNGGGLLMAAGAAFTRTATSVTITGASSSGGSVLFGSLYDVSAYGDKGGDVTVLAFNGSKAGSGRVSLPSQNQSYKILTAGSTVSGNITVLAGATNGAPLVTGGLWTEGSYASTGGAIVYGPATPLVGGGVTFDTGTGAITSGTVSAGSIQNSDINVVGDIIHNGVSFSLATPGNITFGNNYGVGSLGGYANQKGGSISLVAGKNITSTGTDLAFRTRNSNGNAGGFMMIAGANFSLGGSTLTVTGPSASGGSINVAGVTYFENHASGGSGGDVHLLAFTGASAGGGRISLQAYNQGYNIRTGGDTRSGDVTILAGATDGSTLNLGGVSTEGSQTSTGGAIVVRAANPQVAGGVSFNLSTGARIAGSIGFGALQNSDIHLQGDFVHNGVSTWLVSLKDITIGNNYGIGNIGGYYLAKGGSISIVAGGNIIDTGLDLGLRTASSSGSGGGLMLAAGANFTEAGSNVTITGASSTGGSVLVSGITFMNTSGNTSGGDLNVLAFSGSAAGSGRVQLNSYNSSYNIYTGGNTVSGNFTVLAGAVDGSPLVLGGVFTEGAPGASGGTILVSPSTPVTGGGVTFDRNTGAPIAGTLTAGTLQNSSITVKGDFITNGIGSSLISKGDITLGGNYGVGNLGNWNYQKGGTVVLVAGGNIVDTGNDLYIRTNTSGTGGGLVMIAGAAFSQAGNSVTITGSSATGGSILFPGGVTRVSTEGNIGGDLTIVAFAGATAGSGEINIPSYNNGYDMYTGGTSVSGAATILAGATNGVPLLTGGVWTEGSASSTGGKILISPSTPNVGAGVTFNLSSGSISAGSLTAGTLQNSDIVLRGSLIGNGQAAGGVSLVSLANIQLGRAGSDYGSVGNWHHLKGTSVLLIAGGNIIGNGTGDIYIAAGTNSPTVSADITLAAGAAFTTAGNSVTITGASATGGSILYNVIRGFYTHNRGSQGDGGDVTIAAFAGSDAGSGRISLPGNYTLVTGGKGTGINGNVGIFVGAATGVVTIPVIDTTGGSGGQGHVLLQATQPASPVTISIPSAVLTAGSFAGGAAGGAKLGVSLVSAAGTVTSTGILNTPGAPGAGGALSITAGGSILLQEVVTDASGSGAGGAISLTSASAIQAVGPITSHAAGGNTSGAVSVTATGSVQLVDIDTTGDTGGQVAITSTGSSVLTGDITTRGTGGKSGGSVSVSAGSTATLADVDTAGTNAGAITITASGKVSANSLVAAGIATGGGGADINVTSTTNDVAVSGIVDSRGNGTGADYSSGEIRIIAGRSAFLSTVTSDGGNSGRGGDITINAGASTAGVINTGNVVSSSAANGAGKITLTSAGSITVNGTVNSACDNNVVGKLKTIQGGNITITAASGITVTGAINSSSLSGPAGTVRVTNTASGAINLSAINTQSTGEQLGGVSTGFLNPVSGEVYLTQQSTSDVTVAGTITSNGSNFAFGSDVRVALAGGGLDIQGTLDLSAAADSAGDLIITNSGAGIIRLNSTGNAAQTAVNTSAAGGGYYSGVVQILTPGNTVDITGGVRTSGNGGAFSGEVLIQAKTINVTGTIDTSNGSQAANSVALTSTSSMTTAAINASSGSTGGLVSLAAGTVAVAGNITTGTITATGGKLGGSVVASASGDIALADVNVSGAGAANGGTARLVAGNASSSGNISFGNLNTSGATGGVVAVVSLGGTGIFSGGSITTDASATSGTAGSVSMSSIGAISTGAISTRGLANGSSAGTVFITSGGTGTVISAPSIDTSSNNGAAGNVLLVYNSGQSSNVPVITQTGAVNGYTFNGSPSAIVTDITGDTVISFGAGGVNNFNPGGYNNANAPAATVTVDTGGDARMYVPIVIRTGDVNLLKVVSAVTGGNASPLSVYAPGNINLAQGVDASSATGAAPSIGFQSITGSVNLNSINVSGTTGGNVVIASPTSFSLANGASLLANAVAGGQAGTILISVPNGTINLGSAGNSSNNTISASGGIGGVIQIEASSTINDFEVNINATGQTAGGTIKITSYENSVNLYNGTNGATHYNASLDVSASTGKGGTIAINGKTGISILNDNAIGPAGNNNSTFNASGPLGGGTISLTSTRGGVNLTDAAKIDASAPAIAGISGGKIEILAPFGAVSSTVLDVSAGIGGSISSTSDSFFQPTGRDINAQGFVTTGGSISLYTGGVRSAGSGNIQLGTANNTSGQTVNASGVTGGGTITISAGGDVIDYEVPILATSASGPGGKIGVSGRGLLFYHEYWNSAGTNFNYNADIKASSASGAGGTIGLAGNVTSLRDTTNGLSGNTNNSVIEANGTSIGGIIAMSGDTIDLSETLSVTANATDVGSTGGAISVQTRNNFNCCYGSTASVTARGEAVGGKFTAYSQEGAITFVSPIDTSPTNAAGTGGLIQITADKGAVQTVRLTASDSGGSIIASAGGTLTNTDLVTGDTILFQTTANNGNIIFGKDLTARTSITASADGSGNITRTAGATLTSPLVVLSSGTGNIGNSSGVSPSSADPEFIFVTGPSGGPVNLTASTGGNVWINSLASQVNLVGASKAGDDFNVFMIEAQKDITVSGSVTVGKTVTTVTNLSGGMSIENTSGRGSLLLETYANDGNISVSGSATGVGFALLRTAGTGEVTVLPGGTLASSTTVQVRANDLDVQGALNAKGAQVEVKLSGTTIALVGLATVSLAPNGSQDVVLGNVAPTATPFDVELSDFGRIQTDVLQVGLLGSGGTTGNITTVGDIDISGPGPSGVYGLTLQTMGNITGTGHTITMNTSSNISMSAGGTLSTGSVIGVSGFGSSLGFGSFGNASPPGTGTVIVDGDISLAGAMAFSPGTTGTVLSGKSVTSNNSISVSSGSNFTNNGAMSGSTLAFSSSSLTNTGSLTSTGGDIQVKGTNSFSSSGTITSSNDVLIDAANINNSSALSAVRNLTFTGTGTFSNSGSMTAGGTLTEVHPLINNSGTISGATLDYSPATSGAIVNNAGGTISATNSLNLTKLSAVTNNGVITSANSFNMGDDNLTADLQITGNGTLSATGAAGINVHNNSAAGKNLTVLQGTISGKFDGKATGALNVETTGSDLVVGDVSGATIRLATADANKLQVMTSGAGLSAGTVTLETGHAQLDATVASTGVVTINSRTGGLVVSSTAPGGATISGAGQNVFRAANGVLEFASNTKTTGPVTILDAQGVGGQVKVDTGATLQTGQVTVTTSNLFNDGAINTGFTFLGSASNLSITNNGTWTTSSLLSLNNNAGTFSLTNTGTISTPASVFLTNAGGSLNMMNSGTYSSGATLVNASGIDINNSGGASTSGTIAGGSFTLFSPSGNVSVLQGNIVPAIGGAAAGSSFAVETTVGTINPSGITASSIRLTVPDAQTLTLPAASTFTAGSMLFQGGTVVNNNALNATAGTITVESRASGLGVSGTGTFTSTAGTTLHAAANTLNVSNSFAVAGNLVLQGNGASGSVAAGAGTTVSATGSMNVLTADLKNSGTLRTTGGDLSISSTGNLDVTGGTGQLDAGGAKVVLTASAGAVTASQSSITGVLSGSATTAFQTQTSGSLTTGTISAGGTITLTSTAGAIASGGAFTITGDTLNLSAAGNIGAAGAEIHTDVNTLTANTTGNNVFIVEADGLTLGSSSAGSLFNISVGADFTTAGASTITAPNIAIAATGAGNDIIINSDFNAAASLSLTAADAITRTAGKLTTPLLTLSSTGGGAIGAAGQEIVTAAVTIVVNSSGSTFVNEADSVNLGASSVGNLTLNTGAGGNITLSGNSTATGTVTLTTAGAGTINSNAFLLTSDTVSLTSDTGAIGSAGTPFNINANNLVVNSSAAAFVSEFNSVNFNSSNVADLSIATLAGNLVVNGNSTASGTLALSAAGAITNSGANTLTANTLNLSATGNIGASGSEIRSDAVNLTANTTGADVYVIEANGVNLGSSSAGSLFDLSVGASITTSMAATITAPSISITATGAGNDITISSNFNASTGITLTAADAIVRTSGTLAAPLVTLRSTGGGNIGAAGQEIVTNAGALAIFSTGTAFVNETDSVNLNASTVGSVSITTGGGGSIAITGSSTVTGTMTLTSAAAITDAGGFVLNADTLNLNAAADIGAVGARVLTNANTLAANTTGANVFLSEANGVSLAASSASSRFDLSVGGNFTTGGAAVISAPNIVIATTGPGATLTVNSDLNASTALSLTSDGIITRTAGKLSSATVSLSTTGGGNIGAAGQEIVTDAGALVVSTAGSAFIDELNSVNLNASSVGDLTLRTAGGGQIAVTGNTTATGTLTLNASGAITDAAGFTLGSGNIALTSGADIGTAFAPVHTSGASLALNTSGNSFISQSGVATVVNASTVGGTLQFTSSTNVSVGGVLSTGSMLFTTSGNAAININAAASAATSVTLTTALGGSVAVGAAGVLSSGGNLQVNSNLISNDGTIRSTSATGQVTLSGAQVGGAVSLAGTGNVSTAGSGSVSVQSGAVTLGGAQTISTGANGTVNVTGLTSVTSNGATTVAGAPVTITTPSLVLQGGSLVTTTGGSPILVTSTSNLQVTTPDGAIGALSSTGALTISAAGSVTFAKSAGGGNGQVDLTGGTVSVVPGNGMVTVNANTIVNSTGTQTFDMATLINNGTISAAAGTTFQNANALTISGAGTIGGAAATVTSTGGSVTITQGAITATLGGSASSSFSATAGGASLVVSSISAGSGAVSATNTAGILTVADSSNITAGTNVNLTGGTGLNVGTAAGNVNLTAGLLAPQTDANSTDMADYDMSAITSPGNVNLATTSGDINLANNTTLRSMGGNIGIVGPGNINLGTGQLFFAQGGDIIVNGLGNINAGGGSFTAVGRGIPNGTPVYLTNANLYIAAYQGGSIAFDVNAIQPNYYNYLRTNWEQERQPNGMTIVSGPGISTVGTSMQFSNGGTVALVTTNPQKVSGTFLNVLNSTVVANGGVVYIDPPGSQVNLFNVNIGAFGPQLIAVPPPPPPPAPPGGGGGGGGAAAPVAGGGGAFAIPVLQIAAVSENVKEGQSARIVPLDTLDLSIPVSTPVNKDQQCVPVPLAQFAEFAREDGGWAVASGFCESYTVEGSNGSAIISAGGTQLAPSADEKTLRMNNGKLIAMSGKSGLTVLTADAKVTIAADSAVLIEETTKGVLRITQMAGTAGSIEIDRNGQKQLLQTQNGHEIIVAMTNVETEELIPIDGIDRVPIGATMTVADLQVRRNQVDRKQLLQRDNLLNCQSSGCFPVRLRSKLDRMRADLSGTSGERKKPAPVTSMHMELSHPYKSVGFVQNSIPASSTVSTVERES